jgi:Putative Ig domain
MQHAHAPRARRAGSFLLAALGISATSLLYAAAPTISGTPLTTTRVGQAYSFQPTAHDADGNRLTFSIVKRPPWATFSTGTGRLAGTPAAADQRAWSNIVISVSDGSSTRSLPAFNILVRPGTVNKPPTLTGTPSTTARVGTAWSFQPTAKDPEGATLKFSISNKPSWLAFNTGNGKLSGTPVASNVGTFGSIRISATDGTSTTSLPAFSLTVSASSGGGTSNSAPKISGAPATSVAVGTAYNFQPTATDANNDTLTFSVSGKPTWVSFSSSTGRLSGTPSASNVGTTSNIVISVSDGKATASLPAFSLAVTQIATGSVSLSWSPPTTNTDGSTLTNLAGYRINYGTSASALGQSIQVSSPGMTRYQVDNLSPGVWYFGIKSYSSSGTESPMSGIVSRAIR